MQAKAAAARAALELLPETGVVGLGTGSTAKLFYLVPVLVVIIAWLLFGETLQPVQFAGMAVVIAALAHGMKKPEAGAGDNRR